MKKALTALEKEGLGGLEDGLETLEDSLDDVRRNAR